MEQPAEVIPEVVQPKKKMSGWIIAIIVIVVLCCCLTIAVGIGIAAFINSGGADNLPLPEIQNLIPVIQFLA